MLGLFIYEKESNSPEEPYLLAQLLACHRSKLDWIKERVGFGGLIPDLAHARAEVSTSTTFV